ncbi:hypothetical protein ACQKWADRAFT_234070 [Trichoderma austrokoningii]
MIFVWMILLLQVGKQANYCEHVPYFETDCAAMGGLGLDSYNVLTGHEPKRPYRPTPTPASVGRFPEKNAAAIVGLRGDGPPSISVNGSD